MMTCVLTSDIDVDIDIVRLLQNCASPSFSGNSNFHFLVTPIVALSKVYDEKHKQQ